jgi:hypothetical protein
MPTLGNTPRPAYVYDTETDTWVPVGVGAHTHSDIPNTLVDAKGDLITATADNVPARLAKGADGTVLVSDSTTSTGLAWQPNGAQHYAGKNFVVNGGFDIFQRSSSPTTGSTISGGSGYALDRWNVWNTAPSGSIVMSRQTSGLTGIQYCARFQRPAGNTAGLNFLGQPIETSSSILLAGKTVTVSFYARKGADYSDAASALQAQLWQNTTTDASLQTIEGGSRSTAGSMAATLTGSWQRYTFTASVASTTTQLAVVFYGSTVGTAGANDYFEITGVQLEQSSVATSFSRAAATVGGELNLCRRYFWRMGVGGGEVVIGQGGYYSATAFYSSVQFPVEMRTTPSFFAASGTNYYRISRNGAVDEFNSLQSQGSNTQFSWIFNNTETSGTAGWWGLLSFYSPNAIVDWSAEL